MLLVFLSYYMFTFKVVFIELFVTLEWFNAYYSARYKSVFKRILDRDIALTLLIPQNRSRVIINARIKLEVSSRGADVNFSN